MFREGFGGLAYPWISNSKFHHLILTLPVTEGLDVFYNPLKKVICFEWAPNKFFGLHQEMGSLGGNSVDCFSSLEKPPVTARNCRMKCGMVVPNVDVLLLHCV